MAKTVGDYIWARLRAWGVLRVFGYPGDGVAGIMGALDRTDGAVRFVQARHEEMAGMMAAGWAKFAGGEARGEVGVCIATSGPGAIHLLNGLYDAKCDHVPVVAIVGQQARSAIGSSYQQDVDLQSLFKDVASAFVETAMVAEQVPHLLDRAYRIALAGRTVTAVIIPNDLQLMPMTEPSREHGMTHSGVGLEVAHPVPDRAALMRAAAVLNAGQRVAMLVGAGALGATDAVMAVAERLGAGVAKALLGKAVVPDDVAYCTGSIGLLGTKASWELMAGCDTLLMVGSGFPYTEFLPKLGQARGVQVDISAGMLGLRYPMEVNLVGDSRATLEALLPLLEAKPDQTWRVRMEKASAASWAESRRLAAVPADPINPQRLVWAINDRMPERAIVAADSGTSTVWYARDLRFRRGMMGSVSGTLATMGCAVPYAIAAKMAHPDRMVVALVGDGAMQMNGMLELITLAKYMPEWADKRLIVVVLNNRDLSYVTWEQRVQAGDPKFEAAQQLPDVPYAQFAEMVGLAGARVETPEGIDAALDRAFASPVPFVLDVLVDGNVPPLPPHITLKQARQFTRSLVRGEPELGAVVKNTVREVVASVLP
jgi:pyruvate dehydrogenase (quinone)